MRIRQSDLGSFQRCGMQDHLYREADAGGMRGENLSATVLGTVVHYAAMILEQMHHDGREDALDVALATFEHYWHPDNLPLLAAQHPELQFGIDVWLPRQTYGGLRERARRALRDYYDVLRKDTNSILLALEHTFEIPLVLDGEEHILTGTVDRLTIRFRNRKPYLSIEDFKTGKRPTHLRFATQWTVYALASQHFAFWLDFDSPSFEDLLRRFASKKLDLFETPDQFPLIPRKGKWLSLTDGFSQHDAGWRNEHDYARLMVHLREYVKARRLNVTPLTVSGHTCLYCPFARNGACGGVPIPEDEGVF